MTLQLSDDIAKAPLVGTRLKSLFHKLEIYTINDLLHHYPTRYLDYSHLAPITEQPLEEEVTVQGIVESIGNQRTRKGLMITRAHVADTTGKVEAIWFNQPYISQTLHQGDTVNLSGKLTGNFLFPTMKSPEYEIVSKTSGVHTARLVPIYPETQGLSSKRLRAVLFRVIPALSTPASPAGRPGVDKGVTEDFLPASIRSRYKLFDEFSALQQIHFPQSQEDIAEAKKRLSFDELLLIQLKAQLRKKTWQEKGRGIRLTNSNFEFRISNFAPLLPFKLTGAQERCLREIFEDLGKETPMNRLLEGDVGSGKTVLATIAMYQAAKSGYQSILMAPTEVLAEQHFRTITNLLKDQNVTIHLHTGSIKHNTESASIIIGTHALLYDTITFQNVGLLVIDEQHRFGVNQRAKLIQKATGDHVPHILSMTATPIPRTMALALYGDLDVSLLDELPPGRKPIKTHVVPPQKRSAGEKWVSQQIEQGAQVFVICPLIEPSTNNNQEVTEVKEVKAVVEEYKRLTEIFPQFKLGLLHGQMKPTEKREVIEDFSHSNTQILVSTSVIEVGIDIPQATIMVIEGAERFGLAQLHQLRGRVGRGKKESYCFLFSTSHSPDVYKRLKAMENNYNGFALAELDLKTRGPGEIYGLKQSGLPQLKIASLSDTELVRASLECAKEIVQNGIENYPELKELLESEKIAPN